MKLLLALAIMALSSSAAFASDLVLTVRDAAGAAVRDAVVMVYPSAGAPSGPIKFPWAYRMGQQNIQFSPFVLVVPVGADVEFPNQDKVRHHVYSFSAGNKFELKLYGQEEKRTVRFKAAGVAAIGCNIHDAMVGFVRVVDTPFAIKTDAQGLAEIEGLPGGAARLVLWHPYLRTPKNEMTRAITLPAQGALRETQKVELRMPAKMPGMAH